MSDALELIELGGNQFVIGLEWRSFEEETNKEIRLNEAFIGALFGARIKAEDGRKVVSAGYVTAESSIDTDDARIYLNKPSLAMVLYKHIDGSGVFLEPLTDKTSYVLVVTKKGVFPGTDRALKNSVAKELAEEYAADMDVAVITDALASIADSSISVEKSSRLVKVGSVFGNAVDIIKGVVAFSVLLGCIFYGYRMMYPDKVVAVPLINFEARKNEALADFNSQIAIDLSTFSPTALRSALLESFQGYPYQIEGWLLEGIKCSVESGVCVAKYNNTNDSLSSVLKDAVPSDYTVNFSMTGASARIFSDVQLIDAARGDIAELPVKADFEMMTDKVIQARGVVGATVNMMEPSEVLDKTGLLPKEAGYFKGSMTVSTALGGWHIVSKLLDIHGLFFNNVTLTNQEITLEGYYVFK